MDMSKEANEVVLCVSNAYQKKFYLNENFNGLPQSIRDELKIMCVIYTEDIGAVSYTHLRAHETVLDRKRAENQAAAQRKKGIAGST